jgi:enamine deaminase RidA (YjgF/YER057c/UK114 family)
MSTQASADSRPIPAPGTMGVDFEQRVDFDRLRSYRLSRARAALDASELGALLLFDVNNVRYVTSTAIGEWSRDKMTRYALLTRTGEPHVWDFGSAAKHHRLYCPWLQTDHIHVGLLGLRGAIDPQAGLFASAAAEIASLLKVAGVEKMPLGIDIVELPLIFELQKLGLTVRDGQQTMHDAREIKVFISGVTGAPVYHDHPHRPEVFDTVPLDAAAQVRLAYGHLAQALSAAGCTPRDVVSLTRYFTDIAGDQDVVNAIQGAFFGGHLPTSTTVEVKRLATDPRLRLEIQAIAVAPDE